MEDRRSGDDRRADVVQITTREIYDKLNEVATSVGLIGHRIENIERSISELSDTAKEAEDMSRAAKEDAEEAVRIANSAYKKASDVTETLKENEEEKRSMRNKLLLAVVSAVAPYLLAGVLALIYFGRSVLGG